MMFHSLFLYFYYLQILEGLTFPFPTPSLSSSTPTPPLTAASVPCAATMSAAEAF
ncbi:hypothetical protein HETIRDRAFT_442411 [Heterobasidion irregulare TC 32-1]|uniref:B mating type pheromone n=1 Tax=Heterobasidion irregulare (strain TC 32-1) TaxID=747525 RepID=W4JT52_HETIT|nr:uncharacterized protein HETIRDRAFT_442411 [Heterobasidion irregulare TC 32-1]ETW76270.1 hypothetical protein HETIRDRAFT_442411 [Heterobasidion irregulare TC 32-1]